MELGFRNQLDRNIQPYSNRLQVSGEGSPGTPRWGEGCSCDGSKFGRCTSTICSRSTPSDAFVSQFEGQTGQTAYAATKGALVSMTLPMARDLERFGIRVVTVAPGAFITPMMNVTTKKVQESISRDLLFPRRMGQPHEFAQTVKWILECPYVNGETIRLSGGSRLPGKL